MMIKIGNSGVRSQNIEKAEAVPGEVRHGAQIDNPRTAD